MTRPHTTRIRVWHFAGKTLRDGRPLPRRGDVLKHDGPVVPCESGLHGSERAIDALGYAPGPLVALCELGGEVVAHGSDKHAASERHYLTGYVDATRVLHEFACWCATQALNGVEARGGKVDPRSRAAIATKLAWLDGKAADADMAAAWDAARDASWDAASDAAWAATRAAAMAAAWDAAWDATRDAARAAAWDATRDAAMAAACGAAWDAQKTELERRLLALLEVE